MPTLSLDMATWGGGVHCCHQADVGLKGSSEAPLQGGKASLRGGKARAGSGVPGPTMRPGPWSSQAHGHTGAVGSHGGAENGVGGHRLCLAWGRRGKWAFQLVPAEIVLGLMAAGLEAFSMALLSESQ